MSPIKQRLISLVIPVYNEAGNIRKLFDELLRVMPRLGHQWEVIFVDDGSRDGSLQEITYLSTIHANVFFIELSRNFGHQYALKAGLDMARGHCVVTLDADLQHPPDLIHTLVGLWEKGYDVVYTRRNDDPQLSYFKRKSSALFYKVMNRLSGMDLDRGTADFRLMDRSVVEAFSRFSEHDLFIRGLVKWMGFKQTSVQYSPNARYAGSSKYNLYRMLAFAFKGITSFSTKPLILTAYLGIIFFVASLVYIPYALYSYYTGSAVSGWTSLIMTVIFFGSLQLLMLGIIGLYLGRMVIQGKRRPLYIVRHTNHPEAVKNPYAYSEG